MSAFLVRSAASPLRRRPPDQTPAPFRSVDALIAELRPEDPVHCPRPAVFAATARDFVAAFPGDVLYAVKCNPDPAVLRALWAGGVRHFDCASPSEVNLVRQMFPDAGVLGFRYPVRCIPASRVPGAAPVTGFRLFGPTCDSADVMRGPFFLPDDIAEGDWTEIAQLGAYGASLRTGFNGFDRARVVELDEAAPDQILTAQAA